MLHLRTESTKCAVCIGSLFASNPHQLSPPVHCLCSWRASCVPGWLGGVQGQGGSSQGCRSGADPLPPKPSKTRCPTWQAETSRHRVAEAQGFVTGLCKHGRSTAAPAFKYTMSNSASRKCRRVKKAQKTLPQGCRSRAGQRHVSNLRTPSSDLDARNCDGKQKRCMYACMRMRHIYACTRKHHMYACMQQRHMNACMRVSVRWHVLHASRPFSCHYTQCIVFLYSKI
eukprot:1158526-Pelagomonas_calceolata.AAC.2